MVNAYSKKVIEHFKNPHNYGKMKNPDGVGKVGNPVCLLPHQSIHINSNLKEINKISKEEHYLNYLFLFDLGEVIDLKIHKVKEVEKKYRKGLELDTKEITPVRNAVMHTVEITDDVVKWDKIKNVIDYI